MVKTRYKAKNLIQIICIAIFCLFAVLLDFIKIPYLSNELQNALLSKIIQQVCGSVAAILILVRLNIRLFSRPNKWLYLIPCFIKRRRIPPAIFQ